MPAFAASADFAIDKDAGQACPHLQSDFRCAIHTRLRQRGFPGCDVYDCFGAGQQVSQVTFGGQGWRGAPRTAQAMFEVFPIMRQLHELLWYLAQALTMPLARPLDSDLILSFDQTERLTRSSRESLLALDVAAHRRDVGALLLRTSELVRGGAGHQGKERASADLIGADLRGADLSGADLTDSIFLTQSQLNAAKGDSHTKRPPSLTRPTQWSPSGTPGATGR